MRTLLALVLAFVVTAAAQTADACLAHHHSMDWQTWQSPLIFVGRVVKITPVEAPPDDGTDLFPKFKGDVPPSVARVQVLRVIKGEARAKELDVSSGPIGSCAPYIVYAQFTLGQTSIFICEWQKGDTCGLGWGGCMPSVTSIEAIESSLQRARRWREDYLQRARANEPEVYNSGEAFAAKMTAEAKNWPEPCYLEPGDKDRDAQVAEFERAKKALTESLEKVPAGAAVVALALDSPCVEQRWSGKGLWHEVVRDYSAKHQDELKKIHEAEWERLLAREGVPADAIARYLKTLGATKEDYPLEFPLAAPYGWNRGQIDSETLTTEFILQASDADRGHVLLSHGMSWETLADLDASRLGLLIPRMLGSSEADARYAGAMAIREMKGTAFTDLVAEQLLACEGEAERCIGRCDKPEKFKAVIAYIYTRYPRWGASEVWRCMRVEQWFAPAIIAEAEARQAKLGEPKNEEAKAEAAAINAYLKAAGASKQ